MISRLHIPTRKGFTLIEVLLALAIFTMVGIATIRYLQQLATTKQMALSKIDDLDAVRSALSLMRNDLSQAFHIRFDDLGDENRKLLSKNQPVPHTVFDGRKKELIFTSVSHRNYYTDRKECEQTEISYFLNRSGSDPLPSLMKRESPILDGDLYSGGKISKILGNVKELNFSFWDRKQAKWVDDWTSESGEGFDLFPLAIRVQLHLATGRAEDDIKVDTSMKVAFPNNTATLVQLQ